MQTTAIHAHPIVLIRSGHGGFAAFEETVAPYLAQMGFTYDTVDTSVCPAEEASAAGLWRWPLVILAHPGCLGEAESASWREAVMDARRHGAGIVTFGERLDPWTVETGVVVASSFVAIRDTRHPVAALHGQGERRKHYNLLQPIRPETTAAGTVLATLGPDPLLAAVEGESGQGRVAVWTTMAWARSNVLGPLYGLDDLVWRSLVWAARKPFVVRSLPPFATMRVDDVSGFGRLSGGESGFYWLRDCVGLGWKPWVGLFLDDLTPDALEELGPMLRAGDVTACPHAFSYWDFIYFRHTPRHPEKGYWSEPALCEPIAGEELERNVRRVERWYADHPGIPMSKVFAPHYYELSSGFLPVLQRWGVEFMCSMNPPDRPYGGTMTCGGPYFRKRLPPAPDTPVFYADWYPSGDEPFAQAFFASVTEIRDDNGYEWAPKRDVDDAIRHGVNQLARAFDGRVLAQLFTHESGYIQYIPPDRWKAIMEGVTAYCMERQARFVTLDRAFVYMRDLRRSRLAGTQVNEDGSIAVHFEGASAETTELAVYRDDSLEPEWHPVGPFADGCSVRI